MLACATYHCSAPPSQVGDAACLPLRGAFSVHLCSTERDCPVQLPYKVLHPTSYQPGRVGQNSDSYITVYDASRSQSDKSCKPDPTNPSTDRFWCHTQENHFIIPCQFRSTFQDGLTLLTVWYEGLVPYSGKFSRAQIFANHQQTRQEKNFAIFIFATRSRYLTTPPTISRMEMVTLSMYFNVKTTVTR